MFLLRPPDRPPPQPRRFSSDLTLDGHNVELKAHQWTYVAEGGANVLFRHRDGECEATNAFFSGKLLRVKKCDIVDISKDNNILRSKRKSSQKAIVVDPSYHAHYPHPRKVLEYATNDILPYMEQKLGRGNKEKNNDSSQKKSSEGLRNCYEQVAELVPVNAFFLSELNGILLSLETRPTHRRHSQIDCTLEYVMMLPDVTLPPPDEDPLAFFTDAVVVAALESQIEASDADLFDELAAEVSNRENLSIHLPQFMDDHHGSDHTSLCSDGSMEECDENERLEPVITRRRQLSGGCNIFDCCFRNICVEIKPKIGFKPKGALIPEIKKNVCRFCMHQQYKRVNGKVEEISEYCPLDLFSPDPARIQTALRALQRTPQNNFKVFVRSTNDEVVNVITGLSADALPKGAAQSKYSCHRKRLGFRHSCQSIGTEREFHDFHLEHNEDDLIPDVVDLITHVLLTIGILQDLKQMQLLDDISVDGVWHIQLLLQRLQKVSMSLTAHDSSSNVSLNTLVETLRSTQDASETLVDENMEHRGSLVRCLAFLELALTHVQELNGLNDQWKHLTLSEFEVIFEKLLQRFQVATTLKDCSLLLCLRRSVDSSKDQASKDAVDRLFSSSPPNVLSSAARANHLREYEHTVEFRDMVFHCVVAIVDLDVKSHKSVEDYYRLDEKIMQHYLNSHRDEMGSREKEVCKED